jgi:hypothetical protein
VFKQLLLVTCSIAAAASLAQAQPVRSPTESPPAAAVKSDEAVATELAGLVNDATVRVADPKAKPIAARLMAEGVAQLNSKNFDQALANFLEAYATFPSSRILLNIGSTLRDMHRYADAANTYQRFLVDPGPAATRSNEVKALLDQMDAQLTILVLKVSPEGSQVSLDGGPYITVGSTFLTRVRPGLHGIALRKTGLADVELTINGFEGERKNLELALTVPVTSVTPTTIARATVVESKDPEPLQPTGSTTILLIGGRKRDAVNGWLVSGTEYQGDGSNAGISRRLRKGYSGQTVVAILPPDPFEGKNIIIVEPPPAAITFGAQAQMRFDFVNKGAAASVGVAMPFGRRLEIDATALISNRYGGFVGARYRLLTGQIRPFGAIGVPAFYSGTLRVGAHVGGGIEFAINGHLSVVGSLTYEHYFNHGTSIIGNYLLPVFGAIGRL